MNKKFLSLVLALVMVLGTFGSVFAAEAPKADAKKDTKVEETKKVPEKKDNNEKVQWLVDNEVVLGRKMYKDEKNNDLALDKNIQRAEITKLLVYAIGRQDLATKIHGQVKPYSDVKNDHWANGFITVGTTMASPKNALPFLHGYVDGSFKPENDVTYVELAKMLVVLVKDDLTQADFKSAVWPRDWMAWAAKLGILDGVKVEDSAKAAVREDAFVMLYNALYKLGELRNLPANETMGIISDATANKVVLNQGDLKKEFTVDATTNFVPGKFNARGIQEVLLWNSLIKEDRAYYVGSLVRIIADDKGHVSHIVQLGNPKDLALDSQGWVAVADHQVETTTAKPYAVVGKDLDTIRVNDTDINTIKATRYFVADYKNNQLTEVKDAAAALKLFDSNRDFKKVERVYIGYDQLKNSKINEAKVVVFNAVDKDNNDSTMIRVTTTPTNNYKVYGKMSGYYAPETKSYDVKDFKDSFPINYLKLQPYDVVDLYSDHADFVIDYSEDPVYEVTEVNVEQIKDIDKVNGRKVELTLKDINKATKDIDIVADADLFFGSEIEKGAKVQVQWVDKNTQKAVDVVSVVPASTPLKGVLKDATPFNEVEGIATTVEELVDGQHRITITDKDGKEHGPYLVNSEEFTVKQGDLVKILEFEGPNQNHKLPLATKLVIVKTKVAMDAEKALEAAAAKIEEQKGLGVEAPATAQKVMDAVTPLVTDVNVTKVESKPNPNEVKSYDITLEKDGETKVVNVTLEKALAAK